jgi:CRP-like cAMP-binding protein
MLTIEKVMLLRGMELFAAVDGEALAAIAKVTSEAQVAAGEALVSEGDHGDALFVVVSGRARLMRGERVLGEVGERAVIGEVALLDPGPRTASVTALTDLEVLRVGRDDFVEILAAYPEVATAVIRMLARRMRQALE